MTVRALHENEFRRIRFRAIQHVRLQHDFVSATEFVEVVDLHAAEVDLQCRKHVRDRHAQQFHLFAIDRVLVCRRVDAVSRADALQHRRLIAFRHDALGDLVELRIGVTAHVLQLHRPTADRAQARQCRRIECNDRSLRNDLRADSERESDIGGNRRLVIFSLRPIFETADHRARARLRTEREDIESADRHCTVETGHFFDDHVAEFVNRFDRVIKRRTFRQRDRDHQVALIFFRNECRRQSRVNHADQNADHQQNQKRHFRYADQLRDGFDVSIFRSLEAVVECIEKLVENAFLRVGIVRLQNDRAQCRSQTQRHECRQAHRDRDRQCELPIQHACHAAEKRHRHEHRREHKCNRDDRTLHFIHRALGCVDRCQAAFHVVLDVLNHNDCVVDDQADCQHHRE